MHTDLKCYYLGDNEKELQQVGVVWRRLLPEHAWRYTWQRRHLMPGSNKAEGTLGATVIMLHGSALSP